MLRKACGEALFPSPNGDENRFFTHERKIMLRKQNSVLLRRSLIQASDPTIRERMFLVSRRLAEGSRQMNPEKL